MANASNKKNPILILLRNQSFAQVHSSSKFQNSHRFHLNHATEQGSWDDNELKSSGKLLNCPIIRCSHIFVSRSCSFKFMNLFNYNICNVHLRITLEEKKITSTILINSFCSFAFRFSFDEIITVIPSNVQITQVNSKCQIPTQKKYFNLLKCLRCKFSHTVVWLKPSYKNWTHFRC